MTTELTERIKALGNDGSKLVELMDYFHKNSLREITQSQGEFFYDREINKMYGGGVYKENTYSEPVEYEDTTWNDAFFGCPEYEEYVNTWN